MSNSLEFRLLKYIVAVAETSNFTRAAERLFLAQPSLSKRFGTSKKRSSFQSLIEAAMGQNHASRRDGTCLREGDVESARRTCDDGSGGSPWRSPTLAT